VSLISFDILNEALQKIGQQGLTRQDVLPCLIDITTALAIALGGEEAEEEFARAFIGG
jgi:hypothetical protein